MGVSKNRGTPNGWFIMDIPIKMQRFLVDGLQPVIRAQKVRSLVIIQLLGRMSQDLPQDGSHFLCQVSCKQHGKAFGRQSDRRQ